MWDVSVEKQGLEATYSVVFADVILFESHGLGGGPLAG